MMLEKARNETDQTRLLQDMLVCQLLALGVPQLEVRKIVGLDIHRVNRIAKHIKKN